MTLSESQTVYTTQLKVRGGKGLQTKEKEKEKKNVRSKENHSAKTDFEKQN